MENKVNFHLHLWKLSVLLHRAVALKMLFGSYTPIHFNTHAQILGYVRDNALVSIKLFWGMLGIML